jgi:hypothetical protein
MECSSTSLSSALTTDGLPAMTYEVHTAIEHLSTIILRSDSVQQFQQNAYRDTELGPLFVSERLTSCVHGRACSDDTPDDQMAGFAWLTGWWHLEAQAEAIVGFNRPRAIVLTSQSHFACPGFGLCLRVSDKEHDMDVHVRLGPGTVTTDWLPTRDGDHRTRLDGAGSVRIFACDVSGTLGWP